MRRGIIVEKNKKFVTLLTPDGQFLKTKNDHRTCEIGEEITFEGETRMGRRASFFDFLKLRPFKLGVFTMTAIILFILILLPVFSDNKAYAYMTLDINPSIEMALNSKYEVIELTPLNHDAKQVISDIGDWKSSDFKEVISNIITDCSKHGYVKESKEILISTVYENTDDNTYKKGVKKQLADMTEKYKGTYQVQSLESDMETREKAKQEGMSTGSYIRRNEKKTEEKQPEKQTDGNETDQKDTETDADQSKQPDTDKPAADEKTAPDEEKAAEKPGNNETTPGTEEAKPDSQDGNQQTEKNAASGSEENTQKEQDGETEQPPTQNPQENGNDKEPKQKYYNHYWNHDRNEHWESYRHHEDSSDRRNPNGYRHGKENADKYQNSPRSPGE
ncbi:MULTISPECIES: anti-sigma factor domain-containing protein [Bacillus amyloliquefaciens group]|uniref:anti-sigma factor domain-containing protein n=1 Tax=Bacillus amyloliquefaciens group TaxID=1938374 RepID=UPI000BA60D85|nr:anti-sigma factor domain-containing protein [Bacillus velezensis]MCG1014779.1 anti-sigma factor domain-containing protein [Bacillus velezensis]MCR6606311.1 anti-sigma factor domain-containing protein [Bacillus velezensis]MCY0088754.1 anti-sigma factor domain-containing protein [Bacillus velezensis]PAF02106.1 anti-sigma factor [Bacillus velezensis]WFP04728.1 anti-sigma factor domain-containing protein [Bacillus velezensis]